MTQVSALSCAACYAIGPGPSIQSVQPRSLGKAFLCQAIQQSCLSRPQCGIVYSIALVLLKVGTRWPLWPFSTQAILLFYDCIVVTEDRCVLDSLYSRCRCHGRKVLGSSYMSALCRLWKKQFVLLFSCKFCLFNITTTHTHPCIQRRKQCCCWWDVLLCWRQRYLTTASLNVCQQIGAVLLWFCGCMRIFNSENGGHALCLRAVHLDSSNMVLSLSSTEALLANSGMAFLYRFAPEL